MGETGGNARRYAPFSPLVGATVLTKPPRNMGFEGGKQRLLPETSPRRMKEILFRLEKDEEGCHHNHLML